MIFRYSRAEMRELWTEEAKFALWLQIETAALESMVSLGIAPASALESVKSKGHFSIERINDLEKELKHDVIAFLTSVQEFVGEGARYLHYGMTSSDLLDTALAVQLTKATDIILRELDVLMSVIKTQALVYRHTPCIGRSHGIHAEPTTFGLKLATWYAELERQKIRIRNARVDIAVGSISGPVGTYAHLSPEVESYVCRKFGLLPAPVSTQVIARDSHAALFSSFSLLGTIIERIAVEIRHLQRTEVREVEENFTKGQKGSSAMPHKRNPILTENLCGLSRMLRAWAEASFENIPLWHERDISHSSAERFIAPDITITLDFMIARLTSVIRDLQVYPGRMKENLEMTKGLVFSGTLLLALTDRGMSREDAYSLVQEHALNTWQEMESVEQKVVGFKERILADSRVTSILSDTQLQEVFSLKRHVAQVDFIFERVFGESSR